MTSSSTATKLSWPSSRNSGRANFETLETLAQRFSDWSDSCQTLQQMVQASMRQLQSGGWQGRGSASFFAEMEAEILPAMARLTQAIGAGAAATRQIGNSMRQAEEEAARPFTNGELSGEISETAFTAADAYGIDRSNVRALNFDPTLGKEGDTNSNRAVGIGLKAYGDSKSQVISVQELAATVLHESTHADHYVGHAQFRRRPGI